MTYPDITSKRYTLTFTDRNNFNKVTEWLEYDEMFDKTEIGYSDMIIIFDTKEDLDFVKYPAIMNNIEIIEGEL